MNVPLLFSNHPSDSRITGPETVAETLSARMGTGGGILRWCVDDRQSRTHVQMDKDGEIIYLDGG